MKTLGTGTKQKMQAETQERVTSNQNVLGKVKAKAIFTSLKWKKSRDQLTQSRRNGNRVLQAEGQGPW